MTRIQLLLPDALEIPNGGLGEQCRQLLACVSDSYFFDIIGSDREPEKVTSRYHYRPAKTWYLPNPNVDPLALSLLNQTAFFRGGIEAGKPDIVHACDWTAAYAGIHLAKHYGVPLVLTLNLSISRMFSKESGMQISSTQAALHQANSVVEMAGLLQADCIIQVSTAYARMFPSVLVSKTLVIGNGIDLAEWVPTARPDLPGERRFKVVYIGRFDFMKNVHTLLDLDLPANVDLIFIGGPNGSNPQLVEQVEAVCRSKPGFHYVGPKHGQEKVNWLCAADAVLMPSLHEPFGIVALEALASGSLLLSSFVDGLADFLTEEVAVNCGTTKESIERVLHDLPGLLATNNRAAARSVCQKHSWASKAASLQEVYDALSGTTRLVPPQR